MNQTLRIAYNGGYPGYPCIWLQGRPVCNSATEDAILYQAGVSNIRELADKYGCTELKEIEMEWPPQA